jgi:four helix bundle protein
MITQKYQKGFRGLIAWREAHQLALALYKVTIKFPKEERYGVVDQLRRSSSSVAALLAEGSCMSTAAHRKSYYNRAHGSITEVDNHLELAHDLGYLTDALYQDLLSRVNRTAFLVQALARSCT